MGRGSSPRTWSAGLAVGPCPEGNGRTNTWSDRCLEKHFLSVVCRPGEGNKAGRGADQAGGQLTGSAPGSRQRGQKGWAGLDAPQEEEPKVLSDWIRGERRRSKAGARASGLGYLADSLAMYYVTTNFGAG